MVSPFARLASDAEREGWREAVRQHLGASRAYEWTVEDHRSAACLMALPCSDGVVLDLSCGHGSCTFPLAKVARSVHATDPDPEAVRFVGIRAAQSGTSNVQALAGRPEEVLAPGSVDLIVADRWAGARALGAAAELLGPDGRICVGVSNPAWPGRRLPGHAMAPSRVVRSLCSRDLRLEQAFVAVPNHLDVRALLAPSDTRATRRWLGQRYPSVPAAALCAAGWIAVLARPAAPGWWLIASRRAAAPTWMCRTIHAAVPRARPARTPLVLANRGTFTLPVYRGAAGRPHAYFRVDAGRALVGHESRVLGILSRRARGSLRGSFPTVLATGRMGTRSTACHRAVTGRSWGFPRRPTGFSMQLGSLRRLLADLYRVPLTAQDARELSGADAFRVYGTPASPSASGEASPVLDLAWTALGALQAGGLAQGLVHGDLHPGNILETSAGLCLVDWEYASVSWAPFDWCHFILSCLLDVRGTVSAGEAADLLCRRLAPGDAWGGRIACHTSAYLADLGLARGLVPSFLALGAVDFIRRRYCLGEVPRFSDLFRSWGLSISNRKCDAT